MASLTTPRSSRLKPDERRRQILAAAQRLFREHDAGEVSVADIAAEAGVARGLINHYFGTKRELYVEVVREMVQVPPPPVPHDLDDASTEQRLASSIDSWLEMVWRNRELWLRATAGAGPGVDGEVAEIFEAAREEATTRMVAVVGLGEADRDRPEVRALFRAYGGMAEAATVQWLHHGRINRSQVAELLVQTALTLTGPLLERIAELAEDTSADGLVSTWPVPGYGGARS